MSEDRCVCCGEQIPEERQVCPNCDKGAPADVEAACNDAVKRAVKEFADRVKMAFYYLFDEIIPSVMDEEIDKIAKEITGDNYDKQ